MKLVFLVLTMAGALPNLCHGELIKEGTDLEAASKAMEAAGYDRGGLSIAHIDTIGEFLGLPGKNEDERGNLKMWLVDQGVLSISYTISTGSITGLTFYLCDERVKSERKVFRLHVASFDSVSGKMEIQTEKPSKSSASE